MSELKQLTQGFDWYYNYSDSHQAWKRGDEQYKKILVFLRHNPALQGEFDKIRKEKMGSTTMSNF